MAKQNQHFYAISFSWYSLPQFQNKQGRKRPLDTPKRMIERREREKGKRRDIEREGEIRERERVKGRGIEHSRTWCALS